jgi:hypothetical protein
MWQWKTNFPGKSVKRVRITTSWFGSSGTVSWTPLAS